MTDYFGDDDELAKGIARRKKCTVDPSDVFVAREELGLALPVASSELPRIQARLEKGHLPRNPRTRAVVKIMAQSKRDAERRCHEHMSLVEEARNNLFGSPNPPFTDLGVARQWIDGQRRKMGPVHREHTVSEDEEKWSCELLAWLGSSGWAEWCAVDREGPLAQLAGWSKRLAEAAALLEAQATSLILTGSIGGTEIPVQVTMSWHRERGPRVTVTAEPYVPQDIVARAWGQTARWMTSRERLRPGSRRG